MKHATATILTLAVVLQFAISGCASSKENPTRQQEAQANWNQVRADIKFNLAKQQFSSGHLDAAKRTSLEAIGLHPTNTAYYTVLVDVLLEKGANAQAQQVLDSARQNGAWSGRLAYAQGVLLEQAGRLELAVEQYREARKAGGDDIVAFLAAEVECLVSLGRVSEARSLLDQHLTSVRDDPTLIVLAAGAAELAGDLEAACSHYKQLMLHTRRPDDAGQRFGMLLMRLNRYDEALVAFESVKSSEIDPAQNAQLLHARAHSHLMVNQPGAVVTLLKSYCDERAEDDRAHVLLAKASLQVGDHQAAIRSITQATRTNPNNAEAWLVLAAAQWKLGEFNAAAGSLLKTLELKPEDADAHCLLGDLLASRDDVERAADHYREALHARPSCPWASARLRELGKKADADAVSQRSVNLPRLTAAGFDDSQKP